MKLTELFLAELDREAARSRKALEQMPEGKSDWKPHERSMAFGYLSELVATMPTWVVMTVERDEFDIAPAGGSNIKRAPLHTASDYLTAHDRALAGARVTVYLRLLGARVPALYGPSADDKNFG